MWADMGARCRPGASRRGARLGLPRQRRRVAHQPAGAAHPGGQECARRGLRRRTAFLDVRSRCRPHARHRRDRRASLGTPLARSDQPAAHAAGRRARPVPGCGCPARQGRGNPPHAAMRALGVVSPSIRELEETRYQLVQPFVIDASETEEAFGLLRPGGMRRARRRLRWYRESRSAEMSRMQRLKLGRTAGRGKTGSGARLPERPRRASAGGRCESRPGEVLRDGVLDRMLDTVVSARRYLRPALARSTWLRGRRRGQLHLAGFHRAASRTVGSASTRPVRRRRRIPGAVGRADAGAQASTPGTSRSGRGRPAEALDLEGEFRALPREPTVDIHCVTSWSSSTRLEGVSVDTLSAGGSTRRRSSCWPSATAATRRTCRWRTSPDGKAWVVDTYDGEPLAPSTVARPAAGPAPVLLEEGQVGAGAGLLTRRRAGLLGDVRLPQLW